MATSAPSLAEFDVQPDSGGVKAGGNWMYWRKAGPPASDGWVVMAPAWPVEYTRQIKKGMTPLDKYGEFVLNGVNEGGWKPTIEPWRRILQMGGAHEFPIDQVVEQGWHLRPPYREVKFPQIEGLQIKVVECRLCKKKYMSDELMGQHESVAHKETSQQQLQAKMLAEAMSQINGPMAEVLKHVLANQAAQADALKRIAKGDAGGA